MPRSFNWLLHLRLFLNLVQSLQIPFIRVWVKLFDTLGRGANSWLVHRFVEPLVLRSFWGKLVNLKLLKSLQNIELILWILMKRRELVFGIKVFLVSFERLFHLVVKISFRFINLFTSTILLFLFDGTSILDFDFWYLLIFASLIQPLSVDMSQSDFWSQLRRFVRLFLLLGSSYIVLVTFAQLWNSLNLQSILVHHLFQLTVFQTILTL